MRRNFLRAIAACRGEGLGYMAVGSDLPLPALKAVVSLKDGRTVPCELHYVSSRLSHEAIGSDVPHVWVVVFPLVGADCKLVFVAGDERLLCTTFPTLRSKVSSRLLALAKPRTAMALRGFEQRDRYGRPVVRIDEVWPGEGDSVVWRVRASFPVADKTAKPWLRGFDANVFDLEAPVVVMEDQIVPSTREPSRLVRLVTFSCTVPRTVGSFFVVAGLDGTPGMQAFDGMNAPRALGMIANAEALVGGAAKDGRYAQWFEHQRATDKELAIQREACAAIASEEKPLMSVVIPVLDGTIGFVREAIDSVIAQSYDRWELVLVCDHGIELPDDVRSLVAGDKRVCVVEGTLAEGSTALESGIGTARGDYVGLMAADDVLEPDALWRLFDAVRNRQHVDLLYSDEDRIDGSSLYEPNFKTFPNYGKLYEYNYLGHMVLVSRWALDRIAHLCTGDVEAQEYDLALRSFEVARKVVHVPRVLCHRHSCPSACPGGKAVLRSHLERRGIAAHVDDGVLPGTYRVRYELPSPAPKVSIVIPTRDQAELLSTCVGSVLEKSSYPDFEVVLVENNSQDQATFELYKTLMQSDSRVRVVTWEPDVPGHFNYSAIVNYGVAHATGEFVVLLNNDTEVIEPRWLDEMAGCLMRPEVGIVGAKLLFGDGLIQHVGMVANPEGNFCHVCQNLTCDALGPGRAAAMPGDYYMVTGACQMVRRSLFEELGGYDEELAVGFNDGDFCLRVGKAGYAVTVCAHALLHHREFSTRGRERTDTRLRERYLRERAYMVAKHAQFFAQGDPAVNRNLNPFGAYFELRHDYD